MVKLGWTKDGGGYNCVAIGLAVGWWSQGRPRASANPGPGDSTSLALGSGYDRDEAFGRKVGMELAQDGIRGIGTEGDGGNSVAPLGLVSVLD